MLRVYFDQTRDGNCWNSERTNQDVLVNFILLLFFFFVFLSCFTIMKLLVFVSGVNITSVSGQTQIIVTL